MSPPPLHLTAVVPNVFDIRDQYCGRVFPWIGGGDEGDGLGGDSSALHLLYTLLLLLLHEPTSDHQALDPEGWGPLLTRPQASLHRRRAG